jgi:hypothetical protein
MGITLPLTIPFTMSDNGASKGVMLPITLPITFSGSYVKPTRVKIPFSLPMSFDTSEITRVVLYIPTTLEIEFANLHQEVKVPLKEVADTKVVKVPLKEYTMDFKGLIIDETIVASMRKDITILEDIRSRILFDVELINRNYVKVTWYGETVPTVEVRHKMEVDEEWTSVGVFNWSDESVEFALDNNEHNIMLIGGNNTGESGTCVIGEASYIRIDPIVGVLINEKIYNVAIDFTREFHVDVNY